MQSIAARLIILPRCKVDHTTRTHRRTKELRLSASEARTTLSTHYWRTLIVSSHSQADWTTRDSGPAELSSASLDFAPIQCSLSSSAGPSGFSVSSPKKLRVTRVCSCRALAFSQCLFVYFFGLLANFRVRVYFWRLDWDWRPVTDPLRLLNVLSSDEIYAAPHLSLLCASTFIILRERR